MIQDERTIKVIGNKGLEKLSNKKVCVFGVGGVGGFCIEALVRAGIQQLVIIDHDIISESNINRQIIAKHSTIGLSKVEVMKKNLLDIRPNLKIVIYQNFYLPDQNQETMFNDCDYIIDCIDTISAKIALASYCEQHKIPLISSMGTGNKLDANQFKIADIYQTSICPLAKVMRRELKKRGVNQLKVLYSTAEVLKIDKHDNERKQAPGSISFVPSVAGLLLAQEVILDLLK